MQHTSIIEARSNILARLTVYSTTHYHGASNTMYKTVKRRPVCYNNWKFFRSMDSVIGFDSSRVNIFRLSENIN